MSMLATILTRERTGFLNFIGRFIDLVEDAVDAVADAEGLLVGLEVDVARALLDGLDEDVS